MVVEEEVMVVKEGDRCTVITRMVSTIFLKYRAACLQVHILPNK